MPPFRHFLILGLALTPLPALAESAGHVVLHQGGQRHVLTVDPATLGNRSSWSDLGDGRLSFQIDAAGRGGIWIVGMVVENRRPVDGTLIPPAGPAQAASDPEVSLRRLRVSGYDLQVAGSVSDPARALRIDFDLTVPMIDFAPSPPGP